MASSWDVTQSPRSTWLSCRKHLITYRWYFSGGTCDIVTWLTNSLTRPICYTHLIDVNGIILANHVLQTLAQALYSADVLLVFFRFFQETHRLRGLCACAIVSFMRVTCERYCKREEPARVRVGHIHNETHTQTRTYDMYTSHPQSHTHAYVYLYIYM